MLKPYRDAPGIALAHATIDVLADRAIPTHPANYEIWVTYKAGTNLDLNREIDSRIAAGHVFDDGLNEELFEKYFANLRVPHQLIRVGENVARELASMSANMRRAGADTADYANNLNEAALLMQKDVSLADFETILMQIAAQTTAVAQRSTQLATALEAASEHVSALQNELSSAKTQASTDSLTGLANRRQFDETLRCLRAEAIAERSELCLMVCDIDHFKGINDRWGHTVGDQVISFVAQSLKKSIQPHWLAARYGGDEFALVMPRVELSEAMRFAQSIITEVMNKKLTRRSTGETLDIITLSIGVTELKAPEREEDFFERADANLYQAKQRGRNQACGDEYPTHPAPGQGGIGPL